MKRHIASLAALALAMLLLCPEAMAQNSGTEAVGQFGQIDYVNMRVVSQGYGAPPATAVNAAQANIKARRAAVVDARRNLLEVIKKVRIDSVTTVQNLVAQNDVIISRINGVIQYSQIVGEKRQADGTFVVAVSLPLTGALSQELLAAAPPTPQAPRADPRVDDLERRVTAIEAQLALLAKTLGDQAAKDQTRAADAKVLAGNLQDLGQRLQSLEDAAKAQPAKKTGKAPAYTGLVVDARGTGFRPSLRPRIMAEDGVLYPGPDVDQSQGVTRGYARFYRDLAQAQQSQAAGKLPHTIKAKLGPSGPGDLAVAPKDAEILRQVLSAQDNFLDQCRVVVVF